MFIDIQKLITIKKMAFFKIFHVCLGRTINIWSDIFQVLLNQDNIFETIIYVFTKKYDTYY